MINKLNWFNVLILITIVIILSLETSCHCAGRGANINRQNAKNIDCYDSWMSFIVVGGCNMETLFWNKPETEEEVYGKHGFSKVDTNMIFSLLSRNIYDMRDNFCQLDDDNSSPPLLRYICGVIIIKNAEGSICSIQYDKTFLDLEPYAFRIIFHYNDNRSTTFVLKYPDNIITQITDGFCKIKDQESR